jgi:hypothetical protein
LFQLFFRQEPALAMMLSLYVTLGIFMLVAARNPSENRSLIAFTAWSSFAHAVVTALQAFRNLIPRGELVGVGALIVIGLALVVLAPAKARCGAGIGSRCLGSHSVGTQTSPSEATQDDVREAAMRGGST